MFKKMWDWLKEKWKWLVAGLILLLGSWAIAKHRKVGRLKDELALAKHQEEIQELKAFRNLLLEQGDVKEEEIIRIDQKILENKRAIIEAHEDAKGLSDENVEAEFARLGY